MASCSSTPRPASVSARRPLDDSASPTETSSFCSGVEAHAGEADALVTVRLDVAVVVEQLPTPGADRLQKGVRRRKAADAPSVSLNPDHLIIARQVQRLRATHQGRVLPL